MRWLYKNAGCAEPALKISRSEQATATEIKPAHIDGDCWHLQGSFDDAVVMLNLQSRRRYAAYTAKELFFTRYGTIKTLGEFPKARGLTKALQAIASATRANLTLPSNVVVMRLAYNNGLVAVASREREIVKYVLGDVEKRGIDRELIAAEQSSNLGDSQIAPRILRHGSTENGAWVVQEYWPNRRPVQLNELSHFMSHEVGPRLCRFYEHATITQVPLGCWLESLAARAPDWLTASEPYRYLHRSLLRLDITDSLLVPMVTAHGDLNALKHVHRNDAGWRLIDWGNFARGNMLEDWLSCELKTDKARWNTQSFVDRVRLATSTEELSHNMCLEWPGPVFQLLDPRIQATLPVIKSVVLLALIERLVRICEQTRQNPLGIEWLMRAYRATGDRW